jgi:hypothetical protein
MYHYIKKIKQLQKQKFKAVARRKPGGPLCYIGRETLGGQRATPDARSPSLLAPALIHCSAFALMMMRLSALVVL